MVKPAAPPPRNPGDPPLPPPDSGRGLRRVTSVADYQALAHVYAAAYQGLASRHVHTYSPEECMAAARDAVRHFCTVLDEPAP